MPELYFTPNQEKSWLIDNGYNPDEFRIEASSGSVLPRVKTSSSINKDLNVTQLPVNKTPQDEDKPSVFGSFNRGVASGIGPNIPSIAISGRVASALMPLATELAPSTRGLSYAIPAAGAIGTGLLTSLGLNKLQDYLLPESIKRTLQKDVETNPTAFLSGQITSQLPVLKPSVNNLIRAGKTTGQIAENVVTGGARPVAGTDAANLINVGLGAGTGAGSAVIPNLIQGKEINPLEVALATAGGALFSEPTKLGQKLGKLTPTTKREDIEGEARRLQSSEEGESLYERANRQRQAQIKARFLEEEPKGLRASLIKAEATTPPDKLGQKQFDISETDVRPRTFYSESKTNEKGESKYLIPFGKISKEDKLLFPSLINEKGSLRSGVDEAMFRDKLDERLYGDEFREYKNTLEEARKLKEEVSTREQSERTQELAARDEKVLQNITQASLEERATPKTKIEPVKPLGAKEAAKQGTEFGERAYTTSQLATKPVTTLRQKSFNKEHNYQLWKSVWNKALIEGDKAARAEANRLLEPGFADRFVAEEMHGKKQPKFSEIENLEPTLIKTSYYKKELSPVERKPVDAPGIGKTVFSEEEQGLTSHRAWMTPNGKFIKVPPAKHHGYYAPTIEPNLSELAKNADYVDVMNEMYKKNYLRINSDGETIYVEGDALSQKQRKNLIDEGIEKGRKVVFRYEKIYDPTAKLQESQPGEQGLKTGTDIPTERLTSATRLESEVPAAKLPLKAKLFDYFKKNFGPVRNIEISEDGNLRHPVTKQLVKGEAVLREGIQKTTAKINPFTASLDTLGHEPLHVFLRDLETSPHKIDNDIVNGFYKAIENSDDFKRINADRVSRGKKAFDANEIATEEAGIEFARRLLNPKNMEGTLKRKWTDLMGRIRVKWGKASVDDYNRLITEKFFRDPDYIERFGNQKQVLAKTTNQKENKEQDYANEISTENKPSDNAEEIRESGGLQEREKSLFGSEGTGKETKEGSGGERISESEQGLKQGSFVQGANTLRAMDIFGAGMYDKKPASTVAKEAIQNATDSFPKSQTDKRITAGYASSEGLYIADNGKGMTPEEVITKFLPAFESGKKGEESRGSFGLAKIALLGSPKEWQVETVARTGDRNTKTVIKGTPEQWKDFVSKGIELDFDPNVYGDYKIHGMDFSVSHEPLSSQTGTIYKTKVENAYSGSTQAKKMLADISNDFDVGYKDQFGSNADKISLDNLFKEPQQKDFLADYTIPKEFKVLEEQKVEGADIKVRADSTKTERTYAIPVFNRGLRQFELPYYKDVRLPKGISIEVSPTIGVESASYPYTTNRDNLKGPAKTAVEDIVKKFENLAKNQQVKMFKDVLNFAKRIKGTQTKYLDLSKNIPEDVQNQIINSPILAELGKILKPMISQMLEYSGMRYGTKHFENANFSGFASGGDFLGVRFGTTAEGSKGEIYFDPFLIADKVHNSISNGMYKLEEFPLAYSEAISGVSVHEIAHQINHSEGEEHARAMTDLAGTLQGIGYRFQRKIENAFNKFTGDRAYRELTALSNLVKQYENKDIARSLVEFGNSQQYSKRPSTTDIELSQKEQSAEGGLRGTSEESRTKFSEEEQGLKTPEEILSKIKSLRSDPHFQKESTFKRGVKDIISNRIPIFGDDITKLESRAGEEGKLLAPALREYFAKDREYEGKYLNPVAESLNTLNNDELDNLYATMLSERKQRKSLRDDLPKNQQEVYDVIRSTLKQKQEDQIAANQPVEEITKEGKVIHRLPKIDPFYMPEIVGSKQLDILLNSSGGEAYNNLRKDFINFQKRNYNLNDKSASLMFDDLIASYGGPVKGDTTHFGAVRRSEGFGLPESWLESSMALAMRRYWRRVAKDRAFYDTIENDDNLLKVLGHKKNAWGEYIKPSNEELISIGGNETLSNIMDIIQGRFIKTNPRLDALGRIASNLVLGPITGITDLINAAPILAKFIPSVANIPGFLASSLKLVEGVKAATRTGLIRENITSIGDITNPSDEFVERLRKGADIVSKVNTREYLEKASRGLSQTLADYLVNVHLKLAEKGNQKSINLLEGLANKQDYTKLSNEELASRLAELGQGTYDPRGLPSWAIDSQIAPFFRLAKWNIEQLNNLHKHVIIPATKGNLTPLLMTLGGGILGGYMAKEVREQLNLKKQSIPEFKEILNSKEGLKNNISDATYNLAAAISYSGVTGLMGDLTKAGFDISKKNTPQGFNFPLIEIVGDTAVKAGQAATAITEGENPIDVMTNLVKDLAINHTQIARIAYNQVAGRTIDKQKFEDIESRRNLRTYKMVENKPYTAQGIQADFENPYMNLDTKKFKSRTMKELPLAAKEAGKLTKEALTDKDFSRGQKKLSSLKRNNFQTIPSPTADPIGFSEFINFNTRVRGKADTDKRLQRYFSQNLANQVKGSFIP